MGPDGHNASGASPLWRGNTVTPRERRGAAASGFTVQRAGSAGWLAGWPALALAQRTRHWRTGSKLPNAVGGDDAQSIRRAHNLSPPSIHHLSPPVSIDTSTDGDTTRVLSSTTHPQQGNVSHSPHPIASVAFTHPLSSRSPTICAGTNTKQQLGRSHDPPHLGHSRPTPLSTSATPVARL